MADYNSPRLYDNGAPTDLPQLDLAPETLGALTVKRLPHTDHDAELYARSAGLAAMRYAYAFGDFRFDLQDFRGDALGKRNMILACYSGADEIVGAISVNPPTHDDGSAYIHSFFTHDEVRGTHVGSFLMRVALEHILKHDNDRVYLSVRVSNPKAFDFYERMGFRQSGEPIMNGKLLPMKLSGKEAIERAIIFLDRRLEQHIGATVLLAMDQR